MDTVYVRFAFRWWWLVALAVIVAVIATDLAVGQQQPLYRAQTTLQIGRTIQDKNPGQNEFAVMDRLVPTYAELAKRDPILIATAETLGLPLTPEQLRLRLLVTRVPMAPLIDIAVIDGDPQRAMLLANEIARQVILQSPTSVQEDQAQVFIRQQLADLQKKVSDGQEEIARQQESIAALTSAADIDEARRRLSTLEAQVESWQGSYARLVSQAEPSRTNLVSVLSPAALPSGPVQTQPLLTYLLAVAVGIGLSVVLALALDFARQSVTTTADLDTLASGVSVLSVPRYRVPTAGGPVITSAPTSEAAAAYRLLRNILSARGTTSVGSTIAVTSSLVAEGKTTTAANLALALANTGREVILVDANLHNPDLDRHFASEGRQGFGDLLLDKCTISEAIQATEQSHLSIISAGTIPPNYEDLLSRNKVRDVVARLSSEAEIVLFDTPALAEEHDALLLTKYVDGVIVIAESGRVQRAELGATLALLRESAAPVTAVMLNKVRAPRFDWKRLPWSREMRNRAQARQRRRAHATQPLVLKGDEA